MPYATQGVRLWIEKFDKIYSSLLKYNRQVEDLIGSKPHQRVIARLEQKRNDNTATLSKSKAFRLSELITVP